MLSRTSSVLYTVTSIAQLPLPAQRLHTRKRHIPLVVFVPMTHFVHLAALGLVSMMLHYVTVNIVVSVGLPGIHKTGCSGETKFVLHIPSS